MQLGYNPNDLVEINFEEGIYDFQVIDLTEGESHSGTSGKKRLSLTLLCKAKGRSFKVYEYLSYSENALWKLKEFLDSVGLEFDPPPNAEDVYKQFGKAELHKIKSGSDGREYLRVKHYLSRDEAMQVVEEEAKNKIDDDDNVPF